MPPRYTDRWNAGRAIAGDWDGRNCCSSGKKPRATYNRVGLERAARAFVAPAFRRASSIRADARLKAGATRTKSRFPKSLLNRIGAANPQPGLHLLPVTPAKREPGSTVQHHLIFSSFIHLKTPDPFEVHDGGTVNAAKKRSRPVPARDRTCGGVRGETSFGRAGRRNSRRPRSNQRRRYLRT